jgi:hypothetical protein
MSRTWDPWRQSDEQPIVIPPRRVLTPSIVLPGVGSVAEKGQTAPRRQNDFISVLALAQHLNVDFLPITWHPAVETLGAGATAEIRQALVDIQTSFAFKRIGLERKDAFTALASEISVLRTAEVSEHQNIISLVGICWDVDPDGPVIWPVLVFEKAPFGNLGDFLQSDLGRQLPTSQVLSMMIDIGRALACLHRNGKSLPAFWHCTTYVPNFQPLSIVTSNQTTFSFSSMTPINTLSKLPISDMPLPSLKAVQYILPLPRHGRILLIGAKLWTRILPKKWRAIPSG